MMGLTDTQRRVFDFLVAAAARERAPSYDEICAGAQVNSKSSLQRILDRLEERGCIRRIPRRARAIEIVVPGESVPLSPEICRGLDDYARETGTTRTVAANELLRLALGAA